MSGLSVSAEGSGEGLAPVAAGIERPGAAAAEARVGEAAQPRPLTGAALLLGGVLLSMANFMVVLDTTIANVSVPNIAGGLGVSANEGTWVITSYAVAEAITVPLTGWLSQRFGAVRTFVAAMFLFGVFSALCGLSPSLGVLVIFRVLQGLAGGPMIPLSQTLLLRVFPKKMAGQAMGLWAMTTIVAPIAGPILGGVICDNSDWAWVFYINVPVALVSAFFAWRMLAPFESETVRQRIDLVGLALMVVWIAALQVMLDKGEDDDWFNSPFIVHLLIVVAVGFAAFLIWELTDKQPIIDLKVFRHRTYVVTLLIMCLCYGCYFGAVVLQPLWLQTNLGYTATWAGLAVAPSGILALVMAPIVGRLVGKVDLRVLIFLGVLGIAVTMFWRSGFNANIDFGHIAAPQLVMGAFMPLFFVPVFSLGLSVLTPQELAGGAGLLSFARTMAGAFATSLVTTSWSNSGRAARVSLLDQIDGGRAIAQMSRSGLDPGQALQQFERMVQNQAVMLATDKVFFALGVVLVVSACSVWLTKKPQGLASSGAAH